MKQRNVNLQKPFLMLLAAYPFPDILGRVLRSPRVYNRTPSESHPYPRVSTGK